MAKVELGVKRACLTCGVRFYDFNKSPILCPGCGKKFDPENIVKSRKGKSSASIASIQADNDQNDTGVKGSNLTEPVSADEGDDDIDFDNDDGGDAGDDGPGIIQDDITQGDEILPDLNNKDEN